MAATIDHRKQSLYVLPKQSSINMIIFNLLVLTRLLTASGLESNAYLPPPEYLADNPPSFGARELAFRFPPPDQSKPDDYRPPNIFIIKKQSAPETSNPVSELAPPAHNDEFIASPGDISSPAQHNPPEAIPGYYEPLQNNPLKSTSFIPEGYKSAIQEVESSWPSLKADTSSGKKSQYQTSELNQKEVDKILALGYPASQVIQVRKFPEAEPRKASNTASRHTSNIIAKKNGRYYERDPNEENFTIPEQEAVYGVPETPMSRRRQGMITSEAQFRRFSKRPIYAKSMADFSKQPETFQDEPFAFPVVSSRQKQNNYDFSGSRQPATMYRHRLTSKGPKMAFPKPYVPKGSAKIYSKWSHLTPIKNQARKSFDSTNDPRFIDEIFENPSKSTEGENPKLERVRSKKLPVTYETVPDSLKAAEEMTEQCEECGQGCAECSKCKDGSCECCCDCEQPDVPENYDEEEGEEEAPQQKEPDGPESSRSTFRKEVFRERQKKTKTTTEKVLEKIQSEYYTITSKEDQ